MLYSDFKMRTSRQLIPSSNPSTCVTFIITSKDVNKNHVASKDDILKISYKN